MMEPKIRFKRFEGEWKKLSFSDILFVNSGKDYKHLENGIIPVYGTGGYMLSVSESLSDTDAIGIGRKGTIDKPQYLKAPFWTVDTLFFLTTKNNDNLDFLYNLSQNIKWKKYDESTGVPSLSKNNIDKIETHIPNITEQQAIASYFTSLDSQISTYTSRLASLKQMKAASLQAMFPQEGETVPKIRFKGFEGEWKKVKVYEIVGRFRTGKLDANAMVSNGKYHFYTCAKDYFYIDTYAFDEEALLISGNGENVGYIHYYKGKFNAYQRTYILTDFSQNILFVKSYMEAKLKKRINKEKSIGSTPYIRIDTIRDMDITIPESKAEQQAIASYFTSLDHQISLQTQRLEKLKQIKATCLDKMFV